MTVKIKQPNQSEQQQIERENNKSMTSQNNSKSQKNAIEITDKSSGKGNSGRASITKINKA